MMMRFRLAFAFAMPFALTLSLSLLLALRRPHEARQGDIRVVFFLTHDCPISNYYAPEIRRLCERYADRGVACSLVYVDPSLTDAAALTHARTYHLDSYPVIADRDHRLVRAAGVEIAPEAVITTVDGRIRYRGRIDDRFVAWGESRRHPRTHDLRDALDALLAGKPVAQSETPPVGCSISDLRVPPR
jgi:hypothetical protein